MSSPPAPLPPLWAAWKPALLVGLFSLVIRLIWAHGATVEPISDFHGYDYMAWRWVSEGVLDPGYRTPGTPAYYALIYLIFGHSLKWAAYANAVATASTSALLVIATARLTSAGTSVFAGLLYALSPTALAYVPVIASENPAALLLATLVVALLAIDGAERRRSTIVRAGIAGVLLAWLVLTRPITLFMAPGFGLVVLRDLRRGRWRPTAAAALIGGFAVAWVPWSVFNVTHGRSALTISTQGPIALWWDHTPYAFPGRVGHVPPTVADFPEDEQAAVMRRDFFRWVRADFGTYLALCRARAVRCVGLAYDPFAADYMVPTALSDEGLAGGYWHRKRARPEPSAAATRAYKANRTRGRAVQASIRLIVAPLTLLAALLALRRPATFAIVLLPAAGYLAGISAIVFMERYRELLSLLLAVPLAALISDVCYGTHHLGTWPGRRATILAVAVSLYMTWFLQNTGWITRWQSGPPRNPKDWQPTTITSAPATAPAASLPGGLGEFDEDADD